MGGRENRQGNVDPILALLETSHPEQQAELLANLQKSDPAKAALLKVKMITAERVYSLDQESLGRVLEDIDDSVFAYSLCGLDPELRKRALTLVNNDKRKSALSLLKTAKQDSAEVQAARRNLVQKARELENRGRIHMGAVRSNVRKAA